MKSRIIPVLALCITCICFIVLIERLKTPATIPVRAGEKASPESHVTAQRSNKIGPNSTSNRTESAVMPQNNPFPLRAFGTDSFGHTHSDDWKTQVADPESLTLPPIFARYGAFDDMKDADLSEVSVQNHYVEAIFDLYARPKNKHERRERARLSELLGEATGEQTRARAAVLGLQYAGTDEKGRSFIISGFKQGEPHYIHTLNASAADSSAASYVRQNTNFDPVLGPDIDGSGFFFNVNDHGIARQHLEFQLPNNGRSRVIEREAPDSDSHMDHVTGTVGAHGYREDAKGMAPAVMMYSLNQQSNADVDLLGARYPFEPRRSIGGTTSLGGSYEARYTSTGASFDQVLQETPYYLHFYAVGNQGGWNEISSGRQVAKNVMSVGSGRHVNRDADGNYISGGNLSGFSSEGPADDGRIKPDIIANGEGVTSTNGTTGYSSKQGTSMATPNASGSSILLQDYFSKRFPGHLMQSMSLKNLILHTADDLGNPGPDYKHGWGFMNTRKAADLIRAYADNPGNQRMIEGILRDGETYSYTFTSDGSIPLVANLAWLDYRGNSAFTDDDRTPNLTYDLDLRVTDPSGTTTYLPWAMPFVLNGFDTNDYDADAVKADNTTDNVEQVRIAAPIEAGTYTVTVSHKGSVSLGDEVRYSLIVSGVDNAASAPAPTIDSFSPAEGTHHHTRVTVAGSGFLLGANVTLEAPGFETIEGYAERVTHDEIEAFLPLDRVPAGTYKVAVVNPDGQRVMSSNDFVVTAYADLLYENFDAPGFEFASAGWTTGADIGTDDWQIDPAVSASGSSAHVPTQTEEVLSYLESPAIAIPSTSAPIKLSFVHQWDFEIELPTSSFGAHEGEDGALLMVSVDGGAFKHVDQNLWDNEEAQGTQIVTGDYWDNIDPTNPLRYPSATTYAWTDESGGWQRTTVLLDADTYQNKTLRFRWVLGTQNTGTDNDEGWWIDDVSLSVQNNNTLPQISAAPAAEAVEGQLYNETLAFTDADADALALTATSKPAWLSFIDDGNRTALLSGTPAAADVGTSTVTVEADDGRGIRTYSFSLTVVPAAGNNAPTFVTTTLDPAIIEQAYTLDLMAQDADGHHIGLSVEALPAWLDFTDNGDGTGTLFGTPNSYVSGNISLTFRATDGVDTTTQSFFLQILPPASIAFSASTQSVNEGAGSVILTVNRSSNSVGEVSVDYSTVAESASAGADFTTTSGTLIWGDSETDPKTIEVPIIDDEVYNEVESFRVELSNLSTGSELGSNASVTVSISDNDTNVAPTITLHSPTASSVSLPTGVSLLVDTSVTDDGIANPVSLAWSQISGPGIVEFASLDTEDTELSFPQNGEYLLRLTADDGIDASALNLTIVVGGTAPVVISEDGLVTHLNFDEGSGTTAADRMTSDGESNDGALQNGANWSTVDAVDGNSLQLDGIDDSVTIANSTQINDGTFAKKTIGLWFKTSDVTTRQTLYEQGGNTRGLHLYLDGGSVYAGGWNNGENGWSGTYLSTPVSADTWHHVALVLDTTEGGSSLETDAFRLYLDGSLTLSGDAAPINGHTGGIGLGGINNSANFHDSNESTGFHFGGLLDDLVLYNRALSPGEVKALTGGGNVAVSITPGGPYTASVGETLSLSPIVSDDGLPEVPGAVSTTWSLITGPGNVILTNPSDPNTSATFDTPGTYHLRLSATDGATVTFDEVEVTVVNLTIGFNQVWKDTIFADHSSGSTGPHTAFDYKANGLHANGLLYALQINSLNPAESRGKMPTLSLHESGPSSHAQITFRRIKGGSGSPVDPSGYTAGGVSYMVECIEDLETGTWTTESALLEEVGTPISNDDGTETVTVRMKLAIDPETSSRGFLRLKVSEAP